MAAEMKMNANDLYFLALVAVEDTLAGVLPGSGFGAAAQRLHRAGFLTCYTNLAPQFRRYHLTESGHQFVNGCIRLMRGRMREAS